MFKHVRLRLEAAANFVGTFVGICPLKAATNYPRLQSILRIADGPALNYATATTGLPS